MDNTDL